LGRRLLRGGWWRRELGLSFSFGRGRGEVRFLISF
jgi:hypothetical protein